MAVLLTAGPLLADDSARWLEMMNQAVQEQSYHGSYVYERSGIFTTHDIWRQVTPEGVEERLLQTAGRHQEWLRRDGELVCASTPAYSQARGPGSAPSGLDIRQLTDWYSLRTLGSTRIASRPVTVIAVHPKDGFRYAHELYIDNETGLVLKSLLVDDNRELLERFQFATISFEREAYESGLKPTSSCLPVDALPARDDAAVPFMEPAWLPPGFSLAQRQVQSIRGNEASLASQVYSDGLASFTLFIEPLGKDSLAEDLRAQLGPTIAVSRRLMTDDDLFLATVVGEIPPRAAERIAESLSQPAAGLLR